MTSEDFMNGFEAGRRQGSAEEAAKRMRWLERAILIMGSIAGVSAVATLVVGFSGGVA
tara:strand:- start:11676 stop:11849 length:174 start_codon:yes stop_codon:yes gene_type:complete